MYYEHFLFTRNQRRDFTAFIRPEGMTNADVSAIASIIGYLHEVNWLTPGWGSLYCFPMGQYNYLLRHYNSGRTHAGRPISVLEGAAVPRTQTRLFASNLAPFLLKQDQYLNVIDTVIDIEAATVETSQQHTLHITRVPLPPNLPEEEAVVQTFGEQQTETRLQLPFTPAGLRILGAVVTSPKIPPLVRFAFGVNSDVTRRMAELGIELDVVGYFGTSRVSLRDRSTNQPVHNFGDVARGAFVPPTPSPPTRPDAAPEPSPAPNLQQQAEAIQQEAQSLPDDDPPTEPSRPFDYGPEDRGVLTPREMRRRARELAATEPDLDDTEAARRAEAHLFEGEGMPTPRAMRRQYLEEEAARAAKDGDTNTHNWLVRLLRRLFGRG